MILTDPQPTPERWMDSEVACQERGVFFKVLEAKSRQLKLAGFCASTLS